MNSWDKIKIICNNANNKPDCVGCGLNTIKSGYVWNLDTRIPCTNAVNGYCIYKQVKC